MFYAFEGYTESPNGATIGNIQILGFERGKDEQEVQGKRKYIANLGNSVLDKAKSRLLLQSAFKHDERKAE